MKIVENTTVTWHCGIDWDHEQNRSGPFVTAHEVFGKRVLLKSVRVSQQYNAAYESYSAYISVDTETPEPTNAEMRTWLGMAASETGREERIDAVMNLAEAQLKFNEEVRQLNERALRSSGAFDPSTTIYMRNTVRVSRRFLEHEKFLVDAFKWGRAVMLHYGLPDVRTPSPKVQLDRNVVVPNEAEGATQKLKTVSLGEYHWRKFQRGLGVVAGR